ncbi:hypothetical protein B7486_76380, partial [cyanobacterium TDX16]
GTSALWRRALVVHLDPEEGGSKGEGRLDRADALATLGATCLLLVTAPLLSPQYLVWTLPWAAVAWANGERRPVWVVGAATTLTAAVLAAYGPPGVDVVPAQLLLLVRNGALAATVVLAFRRLAPSRALTGASAGTTDEVPATGAPAASSPGS